ncbi:MAG: ATP-binding protein [Bacillota bacterium]|uniref:ExeA family protein n=1 Tax=Desulforudis sp. DRI-14 TaxID=3459793 RepID=UPI00346DFEF1
MFEEFYGLTQTPFTRDIPTDQLYPSMMLEETLGRLEHAARRQLFVVLTGDSGTGKTTAIRRFKDILDPARFLVMYLADSKLTPRHFYKGLLEQLGCEAKFYRGDAKRQLQKRHLAYAGADRDIFSDGALDEIFRFSAGTLRLINKACTHCLTYRAQNGNRIVDDHMVKRVIQGELM